MSYHNIPTSLKTTTSIDDNNDIDEYLLKIYEHLNKIMPISYVYILFLCVGVCWIIHTLCYSGEDSRYIYPIDPIGNSKNNPKLLSMKIYPKKTIILTV
jgi:hypothetical protein